MARRTLPLTDRAIKLAKAADKAIKLFDGGGLFLLVDKSGNKGWRFKYRYGGKEKLLSFGVYPDVFLSEARIKRTEAREQLSKGIDPSLARKLHKTDKADKLKNTFQHLAEEWLSKRTDLAEVTRNRIERCLTHDIYPSIGTIPAALITPQLLLEKVLRPMEKRGIIYSAHRVRTIVSQTLRYGVSCGVVERDSTVDLRGALQPIQRQHLSALTEPEQVGGLMRAIDGFEGSAVVKAALRLHPYVVTRPGELRHMEWSEIDFDTATWEIPAGKMKMKNAHIVPLSIQAVAILKQLEPLTGSGRYAFPSIRSTAKPISDNTLNAALRRIGYTGDEMTSHGWRATFRTLSDEILGIRVEYAEHQLAHLVERSR
jgi:integrase